MDKEKLRILKFFEKQVKNSGYSLENIVENKLQRYFHTDREVPYIDKDESKGRYNDLLATIDFPNPNDVKSLNKPMIAELVLVIECKNLPDNGWIFFGEDPQSIVEPPEISTLIHNVNDNPSWKIAKLIPLNEIKLVSSYSEYIRDNKNSGNNKTNKKVTNLYKAIHTVTKATRYQVEERDKLIQSIPKYFANLKDIKTLPIVTVFQPLIIFKGFMYHSKLTGLNTELEPINFVQIKKRYVSSNYRETFGTIQIVSFDFLDHYLKLILSYYLQNNEYILNNQQKLFELAYSNLFKTS